MSVLPMAVYGLEVPAGDIAIPARGDIPAAFRITMAAIDPSAEPEEGGPTETSKPRATLKIIREPLLVGMDDDDDESDFDEDEMNALLAGEDDSDEEDDDEDETVTGGPSDPTKSKSARKQSAADQLRKELADDMEVDKPNGVKAKGKGKGKLLEAMDEDEDDEDEDDDELDSDDEIDEPEEFVICTLDPENKYQQTLDITIGDDERVWFKVSGTHTIYLTGNYVEPADSHNHPYDDEDDEENEYDLSPDEDELDDEEDYSEDELDDMEDPRITELPEDDDEAPKLIDAKKDKKGKNKRPADDLSDDGAKAQSLDELIAKAQPNGEKLSKKQAKKLKNNQGQAVAAAEEKKEEPSSAKSDKKVQFAEKLEQGPTPSPAAKKDDKKTPSGPRTVQGVTIDDKKIGDGRISKKGDRVGMRYIGKLQKDGKVFDSNKKGKPFSFKLGTGEVIKGWDIGVAGMAIGGERRITVPAGLAYGAKGAPPDIPPNSTLIFDVKMLEIK